MSHGPEPCDGCGIYHTAVWVVDDPDSDYNKLSRGPGQSVSAELTRRHQRLDLRPDGYHLQHRRGRGGEGQRWTRSGTFVDVADVPAFRSVHDVAAYFDLS